jgi:hypothetical protein
LAIERNFSLSAFVDKQDNCGKMIEKLLIILPQSSCKKYFGDLLRLVDKEN